MKDILKNEWQIDLSAYKIQVENCRNSVEINFLLI